MQCEEVLSDVILQAARNALPADPCSYMGDKKHQFNAAGIKNKHLLVLLCGLLDATKAVASAVADNAWDDMQPVPATLASEMRNTADEIRKIISNTSPAGWSMSMSGKELL